MKKFIVIIILLLLCLTIFGQGVNFEQLSFDKALTKAKTENKLVFMDCYTSWCIPCKLMTEKIFPQKKAGDFFNSKFVCVKFDMEKGEGIELKKRFNVKSFPTFFIIRPDGTMQHTVVGRSGIDHFISQIEKGLNEKTSLDYLNKLYEKGKMNKKQLIAYQIALLDAYDKAKSAEINEKLKTTLKNKDKLKKEYWPLIENESYGSDNFKLVINHIATLKKRVGEEKVYSYLYNTYNKAIDNTMRHNAKESIILLNQINQELVYLDFKKKNQLMEKLILTKALLNEDVEKVISIASQVTSTNDVWTIVSAMKRLKTKATKEQLIRMAMLENKFITNDIFKEEEKAYLKTIFEAFRVAAYK
ncbi:thioredoxin family protein [Butyricimonas sp. Marseille-P3923]|uniref:thioredoxin family protein n=1 Tax=Butyricimonas sp. Marseille-P3923 TaxID=1987504 RepID=UPI000C0698EB|nr:thioredoxin family protein [Butyricimonas sp. Marseille-P3923]